MTEGSEPTQPNAQPKRRPLALGLASGLVWSLLSLGAFPPMKLWPLVLLVPLPIGFAALRAGAAPKRTALGFGLGATLYWGVTQLWTARMSVAGWPPMAVYLSLYAGLAVWLTARLVRTCPKTPMALLLPLGITACEVVRARIGFDGYFWYLPAQPLIDAPALAWGAAWAGVMGLGAVIAVFAGAALDWRRPTRGRGVVVAVVVAPLWMAGMLHWSLVTSAEPDGAVRTVRVGAVQTNLPQTLRGGWGPVERLETMRVLMEQSERAAGEGVDLIVWPETMFPGDTLAPADAEAEARGSYYWILPDGIDLNSLPDFAMDGIARLGDGRLGLEAGLPRRVILDWQRGLGVPLLIGARGWKNLRFENGPDGAGLEWDGLYNSSFLIEDGFVSAARYDKLKLTPFGEEMPYISRWDWLEKQLLALGAQGMSFDLDRGAGPVTFTVAGARIGTPICFEATEPWVMRALVFDRGERRADLLVQLTNEGWFGSSDATRTAHLDLVRWQAMLTGTPVVRCANTGDSAAIDGRGRRIPPLEGFGPGPREAGLLIADVELRTFRTPYARLSSLASWGGEWLGWACLAGASALAAAGIRKRGS